MIGGNAVAVWVATVDDGAVRNTRDVDILLNEEDLPQATIALQEAGFVRDQVMDAIVFLDGSNGKPSQGLHILLASRKVNSFRDKDRTHLRDMIQVGLIDASWPGRFPAQLGERLQALLDDPEG